MDRNQLRLSSSTEMRTGARRRMLQRVPLAAAFLLSIASICAIFLHGPYWMSAGMACLLAFAMLRQGELPRDEDDANGWPSVFHVAALWIVGALALLWHGPAPGENDALYQYLTLGWSVAFPLMLLGHPGARLLLLKFLDTGPSTRSVVIAGVNDLSRYLARQMSTDRQLGLVFKGFFDDRHPSRLGVSSQGDVLGRLPDLCGYIKQKRIQLIYIALPMVQQSRIIKLLDDLRDTTASVYFVPDIFVFDLIQARVTQVNGIPVLAVCETPFHGVRGVLKRVSDLVLGSLILLAAAPVMLLIALAVKLSSPGPVLFTQRRYGLGGEEIVVYKFRSMSVCEDGDHVPQARRSDPRVTRLGAFLRRTSLDELPQFINVLQGRMSIVGPRPHAVAHNETYRRLIKGYMVRHKVKPGITGWAQVNGLRGETDSLDKMRSRIEYDLDYLRHWSLWLDLKIIWKTLSVVIRGRNAY